MYDFLEEGIRELERRKYRLDRLEAKVRELDQASLLLQRFNPDDLLPGFFRLLPLNRCGWLLTMTPEWEVHAYDPEDPLTEYDIAVEQTPLGITIGFEDGGPRIVRIVATRAGWSDIDFIDEIRPLVTRQRAEYTFSAVPDAEFLVTSLCNTGTVALPVYAPVAGADVAVTRATPYPHGVFVRLFGNPTGGYFRISWGDSPDYKDLPATATIGDLRDLLAGPLTFDGNTYGIVTRGPGTNLQMGRITTAGGVLASLADDYPIFPAEGLCLSFINVLSGIDFTGAFGPALPLSNFLTGPDPNTGVCYTADYYPRVNIGRGAPAGEAIASGTTDVSGSVVFVLDTTATVIDVTIATPDCTSVHRYPNTPYCHFPARTIRFCHGSKTVVISNVIGGPPEDWDFAWGRHTTATVPVTYQTGNTATIVVAETNDPALIGSDCEMGLVVPVGTSPYPEPATPFNVVVTGPATIDWAISCVDTPPWCCEDATVNVSSFHRDGDATWAGLVSVLNPALAACPIPTSPTAGTVRLPTSNFGNCDCRDPSPAGGLFYPKSIEGSLTADLADADIFESVTCVQTFTQHTWTISWSGTLTLYMVAGTPVYLSPIFDPGGPTIVRESFCSFPGTGIVRHTYLSYKYDKAQMFLYPSGGSCAMGVAMGPSIVNEYTEIPYPGTPVPGRPAGTTPFCVTPACCPLSREQIFVKIGTPGDISCDYHIDAHCERAADPYTFPPTLAYSFTASGP